MNFLAHFVLSYPNRELMVGNYILDLISKKEEKLLHESFTDGVKMHLWIDKSTDEHPHVKKIVSMLRPAVHKYAPVAADILIDHLLFKNWNRYVDKDYDEFADHIYQLLLSQLNFFPDKAKFITERMVNGLWLNQYKSIEGIQDVMTRMNRKATFEVDFTQSVQVFTEQFETFEHHFLSFFDEMVIAAQHWTSLQNERK